MLVIETRPFPHRTARLLSGAPKTRVLANRPMPAGRQAIAGSGRLSAGVGALEQALAGQRVIFHNMPYARFLPGPRSVKAACFAGLPCKCDLRKFC
jgi:hypothetical protein